MEAFITLVAPSGTISAAYVDDAAPAATDAAGTQIETVCVKAPSVLVRRDSSTVPAVVVTDRLNCGMSNLSSTLAPGAQEPLTAEQEEQSVAQRADQVALSRAASGLTEPSRGQYADCSSKNPGRGDDRSVNMSERPHDPANGPAVATTLRYTGSVDGSWWTRLTTRKRRRRREQTRGLV